MINYILGLLVLLNIVVGLVCMYISLKYQNSIDPFSAIEILKTKINDIESEELKERVTNIVNYLAENPQMAFLLQAIVYILYFTLIINIVFLISLLRVLEEMEDKD